MAADTTKSLDSIGSGTLPDQGIDHESATDIDLGIDLGTTRTVVARADRGNYPIISFTDEHGDEHDFIPSLTALHEGTLVHGFAARRAAHQGAPLLRSLKRVLASPTLTASTPVRLGDKTFSVLEVLTSYLRHLKSELADRGIDITRARVVVAVPAHAYGAQRMITLDAFAAAGFHVTSMLNEPSAAGFEYSHRRGATVSSRRTRVLTYDLGGGTFDVSVLKLTRGVFEVQSTAGDVALGGDDFDALIAADFAREHNLGEPARLAAEHPERWRALLWLNPMTAWVLSYQAVLLQGQWPPAQAWLAVLVWLAVLAWLLNAALRRVRDQLVDWL